MVDYFNANELDPDTTYGLTLAEALKVSKATFERREAGTVDASY